MILLEEAEKHRSFMAEAIKMAELNLTSGKGGPFGAVVVKNGKIVARGSNQVTVDNDPTAHAEVVAIREACKVLNDFQLTDCDVYCSCEPCPMCLGAIYWARPNRVFFAATREDAANAGFDDDFIYREIPADIAERTMPFEQLQHDKGVAVLQKWVKLDKKIPY
jgi:tRNA(Arg) A34 adenosine deaminase TadA